MIVIRINKRKTMSWTKLVKALGEFCWTKKLGGSNDHGTFEVVFDMGTIYQHGGFVLAVAYNGTLYFNEEADLAHLPKVFDEKVLSVYDSFGSIVWPKDWP